MQRGFSLSMRCLYPLFFPCLFWVPKSIELLCVSFSSSLMLYSPVLFYFPSLLCIWRPLPLANKATDEIAEVVLNYCTDTNPAHAHFLLRTWISTEGRSNKRCLGGADATSVCLFFQCSKQSISSIQWVKSSTREEVRVRWLLIHTSLKRASRYNSITHRSHGSKGWRSIHQVCVWVYCVNVNP